MPLLSLRSKARHADAWEIESWLETRNCRQVGREAATIIGFLGHRHWFVRMAAASALSDCGLGAEVLRTALKKEKNELVLAELCDAVAKVEDDASVPLLRRLAEGHRSYTVRSYAAVAIGAIAGRVELEFLRERRKRERSRRVLVNLDVVLFTLGVDEAFTALLRHLSSADIVVRVNLGFLLAYTRPRRRRAEIREALRQRLEKETVPSVREALEAALSALSPSTSRADR